MDKTKHLFLQLKTYRKTKGANESQFTKTGTNTIGRRYCSGCIWLAMSYLLLLNITIFTFVNFLF